MARHITRRNAERYVGWVQKVLDEGGWTLEGAPNAIAEAARRHKCERITLRNRIAAAELHHGLTPVEPEHPPDEEVPPEPHGDPVIMRRLRDDVSRFRRQLDNAHREIHDARNYRENILQLTAEPIAPADIPISKKKSAHLAEVAVLHLSDLHWGEVVSLDQTGGLNAFSSNIAAARLHRCFAAFRDLITHHWSGPPPARVIVILGGDLFSGNIHEELEETNDNPMPLVVKDLLSHLTPEVVELRKTVECEIDFYSVPGNHSRLSRKPKAKNYALASYDTLVADLLEWHFKVIDKDDKVNFFRPESGDALFKVFGWHLLVTHGDRIGSKGGQGFIGPAATIARGMKKIVDEYAASRIFIDWIFLGHFHTPLMLEHGFANGCLVGPNEYSTKVLRARPTPATQNFFAIHPTRGITQYRAIQVGMPDEGSLYRKAA